MKGKTVPVLTIKVECYRKVLDFLRKLGYAAQMKALDSSHSVVDKALPNIPDYEFLDAQVGLEQGSQFQKNVEFIMVRKLWPTLAPDSKQNWLSFEDETFAFPPEVSGIRDVTKLVSNNSHSAMF